MSDGSLEGTCESPARKPTPWSVRKIVEQVTGRPLESMQDPPGSRKASKSTSASRDPPLERYHEEGGQAMAVLVAREEAASFERSEQEPEAEPVSRAREPLAVASGKGDRTPSLRAFLPGTPAPTSSGRTPRSPSLPMTRPLPIEVVEEVDRLREEEGAPALPAPDSGHGHKRTELERVYLSYLLMHLDKLTEPALKYLQHAVEEECEERGLSR